ncbi:microsomal glutathione S-transferase 1-like [Tigriopus californicus]|uniref:microsomal glutathione S-transferase 1-like n=1 Tax=Tigriopus californicus TaxID=6832 RepID=UPI0027DA5DA2|nr:microsomal glutathione S-transferase 1-like [Tigriopus californicus]|eukprot:TCALIF_09647-PA protein Name:"Similar to MGST1 Microsomal glutathione S-transferase 1 (Sus scrofa)" AED:0.34 eAED:0.34 QI:268/1/1/1/1/1/5/138/231
MSASTGSEDSLTSFVPEKATQLANSVQEGVFSFYDRIASGEPLSDIVKNGLNTTVENLNPRSLYGRYFGDYPLTSHFRDGMAPSFFNLENDVFKTVALTTGLLGAKLILNSEITVLNRIQRKVFSTPEDIDAFGGTGVITNDPVVERIRRMHLNDIEAFVPFCMLSNMYVTTDPSLREIRWICGLFLAARFGHTLSYIALKNQPWRFYFFLSGCAVNGYLATRLLFSLFAR